MKRIVIIVLLFLFCLGVSVYTVYHVGEVNDHVSRSVEGALDAIADADGTRLKVVVDELSEFWYQEEHKLIHLVRHSQIDDITKSVARLQALTAGEDYSELAAELASIRWQMEHINHSERMILQNLL